MKRIIYTTLLAICVLFSISALSQSNHSKVSLPEGASQDWYSQAIKNIQDMGNDFYAVKNTNSFRAANTKNRIGFVISPNSYSVYNINNGKAGLNWEVTFNVYGTGRNTVAYKASSLSRVEKKTGSLDFMFKDMTVQYRNEESGLRQNFIINNKPAGKGELKIFIGLKSNLTAYLSKNGQLSFAPANNQADKKLFYDDLKVWDAEGKKLKSTMALSPDRKTLELVIDDRNAVYPVTVDPLNHSSEWNSSADGVVSGLLSEAQLEASLYGFSVAGIGDVNGDTYGDIAIGAPTMVDVFSGSGTLAAVGAVFVFYGSPTGLTATPAKTLQPNTCVAGAMFGASIDGGDVTGDGINDIVVGAPVDRIDVTIGILPVNGTVGKIYVYPGGSNSNPNPSNFFTLHLKGSHFNLLSITNNALFGFSVAVTEDFNIDGKKDILVGSPTYAEADVLLVKTGAAFLFLSGAGNTFPTIQTMEVPSFSLLGISIPVINTINGLLFGYSVDGTGDYNNDNRPDIVVGAPAGVDISSLTGILTGQVLGGQAYVYYGTSDYTGVNTNIGAKLQAQSTGLLSNAANLFGYDVKGGRGINGQRNGNIIIGAPLGGTIPNVLGLTIQTGGIHVFKKKSSSVSGVIVGDQILESPRSTSLLQLLNTLDLNVMLGASLDNAYDMNCDGYPDLVAGEPLSSGTGLLQLQVNAVGGAAYIYYGDATGGYNTTPGYDVSATYGDEFLSVNATALFGYSVAGVRSLKGPLSAARILVGSPSGALDFENSVLNLGSTLGLLFDFAIGDNGVGKGYTFKSGLCLDGGVLPMRLTDFTGEKLEKSVLLKWETKVESNVQGYELQRSTDGTNFTTIALVFAKNDFTSNDYGYTDRTPAKGVNYYRLKINDNDAKYTYSSTISVRFDEKVSGEVIMLNNPVHSSIKVRFAGLEKGTYKMELFNTGGQLMQTKSINVTQHDQYETMNLNNNTPSGVYWLSITDNNQKIKTIKIFID
jgi:hypothetical protein